MNKHSIKLLLLMLGFVHIAGTAIAQPYRCPAYDPHCCMPGDVECCDYDDQQCYNGPIYYEDEPYAYDGFWVGGRRHRRNEGDRGGGRTGSRTGRSTTRPSGPSHATMSRTPVSGGLMSGGHMSGSMGAGATTGHGHR